MRFQFSVPDSTITDFNYLVQHAPYIGLTPRLLTINLIAQAAKDHRQGQTTPTPKQPARRETAEERLKREQAEYKEKRLAEYRSTMDDYQKAQREVAETAGEVDPNYPKMDDYERPRGITCRT